MFNRFAVLCLLLICAFAQKRKDLCRKDRDCDGFDSFCSGQICRRGRCVDKANPCDRNRNGLNICDESQGVCVECLKDFDCDDDNKKEGDDRGFSRSKRVKFCDAQVCSNTRCIKRSDLCARNNSAPLCDNSLNRCVACARSRDCGGDKSFCGKQNCRRGVCVPQIICKSPQVCDNGSQRCVAPAPQPQCVTAKDCTNTSASACASITCRKGMCQVGPNCSGSQPVCDSKRRQCVECLGDGDCKSSNRGCGSSTCSSEGKCISTSSCPDSLPFCDSDAQKCVECLVDTDCKAGSSGCGSATCSADKKCVMTQTCSGSRPFCDSASQQCVECLSASDCNALNSVCGFATCSDEKRCIVTPSCPSSTVCDPSSQKCVECLSDTDCAASSSGCGTATCSAEKKCVVTSTCSGSRPFCDSSSQQCVECLGDNDCSAKSTGCGTATCSVEKKCVVLPTCSGSRPFCDSSSQQCVECLGNSDCSAKSTGCGIATCNAEKICVVIPTCTGSRPFCDSSSQQCVECLGDTDCRTSSGCGSATCSADKRCVVAQTCSGTRPFCDSSSQLCVECLGDMDCSAKSTGCGTATCSVEKKCVVTPTCAGSSPFCDSNSQQCVECLVNTDCSAKSTGCGTATCSAEKKCVVIPTCAGSRPFCDSSSQQCVECLRGTDCLTSSGSCGSPTCRSGACIQAASCNTTHPICDNGQCKANNPNCNTNAGFFINAAGQCVFPITAGFCPRNQVDCKLGCVDPNDDIPNDICRGGICVDGVCVKTTLNQARRNRAENIIRRFINDRMNGNTARGIPKERFPGDYLGELVRGAFHSVANKKAQACLLVTDCGSQQCEFNTDHNRGLEFVILSVRNLYDSNNLWIDISLQDFWYLCTVVAIDVASQGTITIPYRWNHSACPCLDFSPAVGRVCDNLPNFPGTMPEPFHRFSQTTNIMEEEFGFTRKEWYCLLGAHAIGRADPDASGYARHWTDSPTLLSNQYFQIMAEESIIWPRERSRNNQTRDNVSDLDTPIAGLVQFMTQDRGTNGPMMLHVDINQYWDADADSGNCPLTHSRSGCPPRRTGHPSFGSGLTSFDMLQLFRNDANAWRTCFRDAYDKMIHMGESDLLNVAP